MQNFYRKVSREAKETPDKNKWLMKSSIYSSVWATVAKNSLLHSAHT